jgi:hypothetical protein
MLREILERRLVVCRFDSILVRMIRMIWIFHRFMSGVMNLRLNPANQFDHLVKFF